MFRNRTVGRVTCRLSGVVWFHKYILLILTHYYTISNRHFTLSRVYFSLSGRCENAVVFWSILERVVRGPLPDSEGAKPFLLCNLPWLIPWQTLVLYFKNWTSWRDIFLSKNDVAFWLARQAADISRRRASEPVKVNPIYDYPKSYLTRLGVRTLRRQK